jgi:hypothetical protein
MIFSHGISVCAKLQAFIIKGMFTSFKCQAKFTILIKCWFSNRSICVCNSVHKSRGKRIVLSFQNFDVLKETREPQAKTIGSQAVVKL